MSANKCARCELTVYPVEGLRCLDKIWHKGCFKCHECSMTLSLKNYKGFEKRPYCNAHCPQAKATTVADTPESRRLAENTRIQSQAKYHEDFERSKGKGFTAIADDPETLRLKNTSKIISNVAYHGEFERKKQMEERRGLSGPEENAHINNNSSKHLNMMQHQHSGSSIVPNHMVPQEGSSRPGNYPNQNQYHIQSQQQLQLQQQQQIMHQKQQQLFKQQQQQQQMLYAQDLNNGNPIVERQHINGPTQQQLQAKQILQQYPIGHPQHQQLILRQQQQHQMMMQQQRQSLQDSSLLMGHQVSAAKQSSNNNYQQQQQQHMIKHHVISASQLPPNHHHHQQQQQQQQMKYMHMNDGSPAHHQPSPTHHMMGPAHLINLSPLPGAIANNQRAAPNQAAMPINGPQGGGPPHHMMHGYGGHPQMGHHMNGAMPKQQHFAVRSSPQATHHQTVQMQPINNHHNQMRTQQMLQSRQQQQQVPRRVFRAMYDYVANDVDEVSFFENDILIDCVNVDGNWLIGKVARSGQTGMLPANYVTEFSSQ